MESVTYRIQKTDVAADAGDTPAHCTPIARGFSPKTSGKARWESDYRSTSRMLSDMLGEGTLQSRIITAGGASDRTTSAVHAANDVAPET